MKINKNFKNLKINIKNYVPFYEIFSNYVSKLTKKELNFLNINNDDLLKFSEKFLDCHIEVEKQNLSLDYYLNMGRNNPFYLYKINLVYYNEKSINYKKTLLNSHKVTFCYLVYSSLIPYYLFILS